MKISIIGCGKMGSGIAGRLAKEHQLALFDRDPQVSNTCAKKLGATACIDIAEAISFGEMIILAVKPQDLRELAQQAPPIGNEKSLVSILAGATSDTLKNYFPNTPVLRMMPNLACLYGEGVIGLADDESLPSSLKDKLEKAFLTLGHIHWFPEEQMNALTALTGSGPAFLMEIMKSIVEAGIAMGFSQTDAEALALELWQGSSTMLKDSIKSPSDWVREIASPGGTTAAGLEIMKKQGVHKGMISAFAAACQRAKELSRE